MLRESFDKYAEQARSFFKSESEGKSEKASLVRDLRKELNQVEEFAPYLPKIEQEKAVDLGEESAEKQIFGGSIAHLTQSEGLSKRAQAADKINLALRMFIHRIENHIGQRKEQSARILEIYEEMKKSMTPQTKLTEVKALLDKVIADIETI